MFWYIFRIKPFPSLIENHIKRLRKEREAMIERRKIYPKDSFGYARISLGIEVWEFKIEIWKAIIGVKKKTSHKEKS